MQTSHNSHRAMPSQAVVDAWQAECRAYGITSCVFYDKTGELATAARIVFDLPAAEPYARRPMPAQAEFAAFEKSLIERVFAAPDEPQAD